jgi:hypothetical protein
VKNEGLRFCVCVVIQFAAASFSCYKHALFLELGRIHSSRNIHAVRWVH